MAKQKTAALADYEVTTARVIAGLYHAQGTVIKMTPEQAKYYIAPYGTGLKRVSAKTVKPKADA